MTGELVLDADSLDETPRSATSRSRLRALGSRVTTALAFMLIWFALVAPNQLDHFTPIAFARIPIEGLVVIAACLYLPAPKRHILAVIVGVALALLTILNLLNVGFNDALERPFNPVSDWSYLGSASGVLRDSIGGSRAMIAEIGSVLLIIAVLVLMPLAALRLTGLAVRRRNHVARTVSVLAVVWLVAAAFGVQFSGEPIASRGAAALAYDQLHQVRTALKDKHTFASAISAPDSFAITPGADLLTQLRGKDVVVAFVESYGQVAVQGSTFSPQIDAVLKAGTTTLNAAQYASRSAFLTSPTFGGISWLAHSTLQSGLWVNSQQRYNQLVDSQRFTLSDAFKRAGWRTVSDVPSDAAVWPEGTSFYHYDALYNEHNVGYTGPRFSYASMPDQYSLAAFQRLELSKPNHVPVMAEIDLVTSHTPWTPLPSLISWSDVGDGSIYKTMPAQGQSPDAVWRDANQVRTMYGESIQYSLNALISFVQTFHNDNLVLILLGDHQPASIVSGPDASHEVPITIIAHDPEVMNRISSWGWQAGMLPNPQAPVWAMDAFRDRFLRAYGP